MSPADSMPWATRSLNTLVRGLGIEVHGFVSRLTAAKRRMSAS